MKHRAKMIGKWFVGFPFLMVYVGLWAMPGSFWFDPGLQVVSRGPDGMMVAQERVIRWDFLGEYHVIIRHASDLFPVCEGEGGPFTYRQNDGSTPSTMSLEDWAGGRCGDLPPGRYVMQTTWTVLRPLWGLLPRKFVSVDSDIFEVTE